MWGWAAMCLSFTVRLPQLWLTWKSRDVTSLSLTTLIAQTLVCPLYIAHGFEIEDPPLVVLGFALFFQALPMLLMYYFYRDVTNGQSPKIRDDIKDEQEVR